MNILTDILKTVLTPLLEKYLAARKERKELERFYNTLIELSDKYIREHETEAVAKANCENVYTWLSERLTISTISPEEKCFCNTLLDEISQSHAMHIDKPWDIREITSFIKKVNFAYY